LLWERTIRAGRPQGEKGSSAPKGAFLFTSHQPLATSHCLSRRHPTSVFPPLTSAFLIADPRLEIAVTRRKQRIGVISNRLKTGGYRFIWARHSPEWRFSLFFATLRHPTSDSLPRTTPSLIATVANSGFALNSCKSSRSHFPNPNKIGVSAQRNDVAASVTIGGGTIQTLAVRSRGGTQ